MRSPGSGLFLEVCTAAVTLAVAVVSGCARLPLIGDGGAETAPADGYESPVTPRELLGARLINPRADTDAPPLTVGKLIELADRYLSCDCADTRFVKSWKRTAQGYLLTSNSESVHPLEFVCERQDEAMQCFLTEIDRGAQAGSLEQRFVPGAEFIRFIYENGVNCRPEQPCP